ncbi:MAG: FAD-binding protein [Desulfohalobiaceae bacterium]|nr:FAD-binding protein [Desulfohalobiaceae bacterium]
MVAVELCSGQLHTFTAKAILFATGGFGRMYRITSNAYANTGDGPAILARRGGPLEEMEFFQFHPTGIRELGILISEAVRGEGGVMRNSQGERFMERYAPSLLDLAPRDLASRAMMTEILQGRGIRGDRRIDDYLYLDATHLGREILDTKLPDISTFSKTYLDIDPAEQPIPVHPTTHYAMGGIPTDVNGRVRAGAENTFYEGLYAAGECACVSVHGANRLGTNSLLDLIVFGRRAGRHIAEYVGQAEMPGIARDEADPAREKIDGLMHRSGGGDPHGTSIRETMQNLMTEKVGVYRDEEGLSAAVRELKELRRQYQEVRVQDRGAAFNFDLLEVLELQNTLDLALITAGSAKNRQESRGAHSREDHPERDDENWLSHSLAYLTRLFWDRRPLSRPPVST